jgi:hypothetical protein
MEAIFAYDLTLCKNILETLNLPNEQLVQLTIRSANNFDHIISVQHKDIPWGPTHALPSMFSHPQITTIKWFPQESEPKYELTGNPKAVYLMIRRRLFTQLQYILYRIIQQLDFLFVPALDICAQLNTIHTSATPILSGLLAAPAQPGFMHPLNTLVSVISPPPEQFTDADSDISISYFPKLPPQSSPPVQPECLSPLREFTHVQTQTDKQHNQILHLADSPWAWLDN